MRGDSLFFPLHDLDYIREMYYTNKDCFLLNNVCTKNSTMDPILFWHNGYSQANK